MKKKSNRVDGYLFAISIASVFFCAWETQQTMKAMSEPAWQEPVIFITFAILAILLISKKTMIILLFPVILREIGPILRDPFGATDLPMLRVEFDMNLIVNQHLFKYVYFFKY